MQCIEQLQVSFSMAFEETLEHAVFMKRFLIHNKLAVSTKEVENPLDDDASDSSSKSSDNDNADVENADTGNDNPVG